MCPTCMVLTDSHHVPTTDTLTGIVYKSTKKNLEWQFFFRKNRKWTREVLDRREALNHVCQDLWCYVWIALS